MRANADTCRLRRRHGRRHRRRAAAWAARAAGPSAGCRVAAGQAVVAGSRPVTMLVTTSGLRLHVGVASMTSLYVPSVDAEAQPHRLELLVFVQPRRAARLDIGSGPKSESIVVACTR